MGIPQLEQKLQDEHIFIFNPYSNDKVALGIMLLKYLKQFLEATTEKRSNGYKYYFPFLY